ncbi:N-acetylneuraminate synthase (EC [Olavius sp. associated proteobacterium Delta 1]|nr:N-acetylneuraminate synthase (EC [Olavius sp. associated proteobacterium Delta 1]
MIVAIIPAKEESNRLPNKNLLTINGKSLVEHAIEFAKKSHKIDHIYVSTDSEKIAAHVNEIDVDVIMRSKDLSGETPLIQVYRHALSKIDNDNITHIVGIQPDNPDRNLNPDMAIDYAIDKNIDSLFTVNRNGRRNGSLAIIKREVLEASDPNYCASLMDDCINIHNQFDFLMATRNLSRYADTLFMGNRIISKNDPVFIVAEAACNHMCRVDSAKRMIELASEAGVDAIKFQTYQAENLVSTSAKAFWGNETISQLEYYKKLDRFGKEEYEEIFIYAKEKGIIAFSSPFDAKNAEMLNEIGMPIFKIASCDIDNVRHLQHIASFGKPIILSTGASTMDEIDKAIEVIFKQDNYQLILLACTLSYPTKNEDANLLKIQTLQERYPGMIIGLSDHTEPDPHMVIPSVAVALGAKIIEKHFTLDRSMTGSGHFFAVEPEDLCKLVRNIRLTETLFGDGSLGVADSEKEAWASARRSITAEIPIPKGRVITEEMLSMKRPALGLSPAIIDELIGKRAIRDITAGQPIVKDMVDWDS